MSFDFRTVREPSNDPVLKYIVSLQKALSKSLTKGLIDQLDSSEDIFGDVQDVESAIKFQTDLNYTHKFLFDKDYYAPNDIAEGLSLWIRGINMGPRTRDFSGNTVTPQTIELIGDPLLVSGNPFDHGCYDGSVIKSLALRFNRPTSSIENTECINVLDNIDINLNATALSIFIRFRLFDLGQQGGIDRRIYEKIDDVTATQAYGLKVASTGRLSLSLKRNGGSQLHKQTDTGVITTNTVYDVWLVWDGTTVKLYVNNEDKSLTDTTELTWRADKNNNDLCVFGRAKNATTGFTYGDLYDFKIYNENDIDSTQVGNHWINKLSVSDMAFGHVIMANHWSTITSVGDSYTDTSYTTTSYT